MIVDDERRNPAERLGFVLHPATSSTRSFGIRRIGRRDITRGAFARIVRYASGEKHADFHVPTTVDV
jgi:hypothetical protein